MLLLFFFVVAVVVGARDVRQRAVAEASVTGNLQIGHGLSTQWSEADGIYTSAKERNSRFIFSCVKEK